MKFLAAACNASTEGLAEGSSELYFFPGTNRNANTEIETNQGGEDDVVRELVIEQQTPGSIYLILQALLPYILFGPYVQKGRSQREQRPVRLRVTGGTNVSFSPSHEYATRVLFPMLEEHLGITPIRTTLVKRGWSAAGQRSDMGEVVFEVTPLVAPLPAFRILGRGALRRIEVCVIANPVEVGREIAEKVCGRFEDWGTGEEGKVQTEIALEEDSRKKNRIYALVIAEFEDEKGKRLRLGRDCLFEGSKKSKGENLVEVISKKLISQIEREIKTGGAVDEYMQDQLVVFQALAEGSSVVERVDPSLHAQTARWVAGQVLKKAEFGEDGDSKGVGFAPIGTDG